MPAKTGASHAAAAFLSILLGTFISDLLDAHLGLIAGASTGIGGLLTSIPGISLSDEVAGFLVISTVLAFFWGVAYHYSRHGFGQPKNYVSDEQSQRQGQQMSTQSNGVPDQLGNIDQHDGGSYSSIRAMQLTDERLKSRLARDVDEIKSRLDNVHDRLYDAGNRADAKQVQSIVESIIQLERTLSESSIRATALQDADDTGTNREAGVSKQTQKRLVSTHDRLVESSEELLATARTTHHSSPDQLDTELIETCERLVDSIDRTLEERQDILRTEGENK